MKLPKNKKNKIIVGLSGGVDSAVAVALLKKDGWDVTGVFIMQNDADTQDVENICQRLDIPLKIIDARERFKNSVIKYFLEEYRNGRTPNPCVFCNENFKFKILFEVAAEMGVEYVSTGHYARIIKKQDTRNKQIANNKSQISNKLQKQNLKLQTAKDENKDQSYFLYRLTQEELARIIFPLGEYEKTETRERAKKFKLPVHDKAESQDICFLAGTTTEKFLEKNIKSRKGKIINGKGQIIGEHQGLPLYTLGQRKGINIGGTGPYYVLGKEHKKNTLVVTNDKKELSMFSTSAILKDVNFPGEKPKFPARVLARTRYRNPLVYATIKSRNVKRETRNEIKIEFEKPQRAVTPGQSCVFYDKDGCVVGGGIFKD
jgi:tRNA-specific 2-thiouridylase